MDGGVDMASIGKTYIDGKEYPLYRSWWIENYEKMQKELGRAIWLYPFSIFNVEDITPEFLLDNNQDLKDCAGRYDFPIWNTSESVDKWLVRNCDIPSFRSRMLDVYPFNWSGFRGQNWIPKPKNKQKYIR